MSNEPKPISIVAAIRATQLRTHASTALLGAAISDQQLQDAILSKMRKLSRRLEEELFTGYGPLSSLSAKIALAYALELLDTTAHKRLTVARQIRNKFAHADDLLTFESPESTCSPGTTNVASHRHCNDSTPRELCVVS